MGACVIGAPQGCSAVRRPRHAVGSHGTHLSTSLRTARVCGFLCVARCFFVLRFPVEFVTVSGHLTIS